MESKLFDGQVNRLSDYCEHAAIAREIVISIDYCHE